MIQVYCMYCRKPIRVLADSEDTRRESHGICSGCLPRLLEEFGVPMAEFLDRLAAPILVVGPDVELLAANAAAEDLLGKTIGEVAGALCGNVIGCVHAEEPGGCGCTVHCQSCAIRRSVTHTMRTGDPCRDVPAYADLGTLNGDKRIAMHINTEKRGDFVLLSILDATQGPKPLGA